MTKIKTSYTGEKISIKKKQKSSNEILDAYGHRGKMNESENFSIDIFSDKIFNKSDFVFLYFEMFIFSFYLIRRG
jgi:hypothetical protein